MFATETQDKELAPMCDKKATMRKAVEEYAAMRTIELLLEGHFSAEDLALLISHEVAAGVKTSVEAEIVALLATSEVSVDQHMRLFLPEEES